MADKWIGVRNGIWASAVVLHMRNAVWITWPQNSLMEEESLRGSNWPSCGLSHDYARL